MRLLVAFAVLTAGFAATPVKEIRVDQVGYPAGSDKTALVVSPAAAGEFTLRRATDGATVFRGKLGASQPDPDSGDTVQPADFTSVKTAGRYYLDVAGVGRSWEFEIGPDVYSRAFYLAMRSYYGQRCGIAVDLGPEFPGFRHAACHLDGAWHASTGKSGPRISKGGWHDAGDYGRYVVNSGITTGTLLWAYELFAPRVRPVNLNLPESGNGTPDILNEVRWNLDWMLSLQDEDGGVWHKQTSEQFCPFVMPEVDHLVSYVIGTGQDPFKSSCATGDLTAVAAIAARLYQPFDAAFATRCLRAAKSGFDWLEKHPNVTFRNPEHVGTGGYGDNNCADEHLWAAAELWRTTHEAAYRQYFLDHQRDFHVRETNPQSWGNVGNMALWTYALGSSADSAEAAATRQESLQAADRIVARTAANPYRISMTTRDYTWGSNAVAANYGMQLLVANALRPDPAYVAAALGNLHYLLGRNAFSMSYVTQVGSNPVMHPHHRPSGADRNPDPWPGLLAGGPNRSRQDPAMRDMKKLPADLPPARMYLDDQEAYAANEVAINWNAPLVFLLAGALAEK